MTRQLSGVICAGLFSLGLVPAAEAALTHWGAQSIASVADCPSFCTNFNFGDVLGGENTGSSGISEVDEARGNARASAALSGGFNTPVLKAESTANASKKGAFATAFAVQGYTYNGPGETLTLDVNLDGLISDLEFDAFDTRVTLEAVLYQPEPFEFFSDRGTLDFEVGATPLTQTDGLSEASVFLQLDHTNPTNAFGSVIVDVATGDEFYLWTKMVARSESGFDNGTSADAFNTGTMGFQGTPDLVPTGAVPLPAAAWLFGSGLIFLAGVARRRKA